MKKILLTVPLIALLGACETQEQSAGLGALTGAALGASLVGEEDETEAILIGAAAGAAAGAALGGNQQRQCVYRNPNTGQQYTAACP
jgi:Glycine zipper